MLNSQLLVAATLALLLSACASVPQPPPSGTFALPDGSSQLEPLLIRDRRVEVVEAKAECEEAVSYADDHFSPLPIVFIANVLQEEIEMSEWSEQARKWLQDKEVSLVLFRARGGKRCARPVDSGSTSAYAAVSPAGPAIGLLILALAEEAKRAAYVELDIAVRIAGKEFRAGAISTRQDGRPEGVFIDISREVMRTIVRQIGEEAVGLRPAE